MEASSLTVVVHRFRRWSEYTWTWEWISEVRRDGRHVQGFGPFDRKADARAAAEARLAELVTDGTA